MDEGGKLLLIGKFITFFCSSFSILLEIFKMDKKARPPKKTIIDTRYFEKKKLPGKISKCEFKLKKDQCVLLIHKAVPGVWANALSL